MFSCSNCGAELRFDIQSGKLLCTHCGNQQDPATYETEHKVEENTDSYDVKVYTCPSCGGQIVSPSENEVATFCSFCGASHVLEGKMDKSKRPKFVIPFKKTKEDCKKAYASMMRKALYAPKELRDPKFLETFRGIYVPYWVYTIAQEGTVTLKATDTYRRGDYVYTNHYAISDYVSASYKGLSYDASSSFDDRISETIAPFDSHEMLAFAPSYLAGFFADTADVPAKVYTEDAKTFASEETYQRLRKNVIGYSVTEPDTNGALNRMTHSTVAEENSALFPVWFLTYHRNNRVAYAVVNGENGRISSDLPVDIKRYIIGSLLMAIPFFILLNLKLTLIPATLLTLVSFLSMVAAIFYVTGLNALVKKDLRTDDKGYQYTHADPDDPAKDPTTVPRKKWKKPGWLSGVSLGGFIIILSLLFTVGTSVFYVLASGFLTLVKSSALVSFIATVVTLGLTGYGISLDRKTPGKQHVEGLYLLSLASIIATGVLTWKPVSDLYYYAAVIVAILSMCFAMIGLISEYNLLATRPLPQFNRHVEMLFLALLLGLLFQPMQAHAEGYVDLTNQKTGYQLIVNDEADLFSETELKSLEEEMAKTTEWGNAAVITTDYNDESSTRIYTQNQYYTLFENQSGAVFVIDMDNREIYLCTNGAIYKTVTSAYANTITDNVYRYASKSQYGKCATQTFVQINTLMGGAKIAQPMKYVSNALLALFFAFMFNYFFIKIFAAARKPSRSALLDSCDIKFSATDHGERMTGQTKRYSPQSSDSGSGGSGGGGGFSGGGGGGGGFSGGGGGHSF
jgi:uncharacterized membrane protein YgcG/predicted RNA-binding Zn-ribbon protein involved in translation (DUF1610 family)